MDIRTDDLRPLLGAYVEQYTQAFDSVTPADFWLHEASRRCRSIADGDPSSLDSTAVDKLLATIINGEVDDRSIVERHPATYASWWKAMHALHQQSPKEVTKEITNLLNESTSLKDRLETFEATFTPALESIGAENPDFTESITPGKVYGISTFLLELFNPESYVTYRYRTTKQFFDEYSNYTIRTASSTNLAEQYVTLLDGYESVLTELRQLHPEADMHDVHAIIFNREKLDRLVESGDGVTKVDESESKIRFSTAGLKELRGTGGNDAGSRQIAVALQHITERIGREFSEYEWLETLIWESPSPGSPYLGPTHNDLAASPYLWLGVAHEQMATFGRTTKGLQMEFGIDTSEKDGFFGRDVLCGVYFNSRTGDEELAERIAVRVADHADELARLLQNDKYMLYLGDTRLVTPSAEIITARAEAVHDGFLLTRDVDIDELLDADDVGEIVIESFLELLPYYGDLVGTDDFDGLERPIELGPKPDTPSPTPDKPDKADQFARHLEAAKQLILHGPPGTGKTAQAHEFINWWVDQDSAVDQPGGHVVFVSFHPSYAYEDFVEGVTATTEDGEVRYEVQSGPFKRICERAKKEYDRTRGDGDPAPYVLLIDEINRGNVAELFGEAISLIEPDKRAGQTHEMTVNLPHSGEELTVPPNLYIIGTMNTADRSIALVDAALRRRFRFQLCPPDYEYLCKMYGFVSRDELKSVATDELTAETLAARSILGLEQLNEEIRVNLDRGRQIGHSYLLNADGDPFTETQQVVDAWQYEILPLVEEYYFGQFDRMRRELFNGTALDLIDWDGERIAEFDAEVLATSLETLR